MHPVLFKVGPFTLHTYGVFVAAAFFLAIFLSLRLARKEGMNDEQMLDLAFYITLSAIIGARILFVIVEYPYFLENPLRIFKIWEGGLVFFGGLILAVIVAVVYMKRHGMPVLKVGDCVAPSMILAQSVGRFGCLSAGCCYGRVTKAPWGIVFTDPNSLVATERLGLPLHPTQLYSSGANLLLFLFLMLLYRKKRFDGQVLLAYGMLYPIVRSVVEFFRGDPRGAMLGGQISTSQGISAVILVISAILYIKIRRDHDRQA
ncbi:MAG: prolipoprotein diacylglyceryl transferase [bacterium]|nr:prolipoprotein diacylglyceryl transferase [bacterium]